MTFGQKMLKLIDQLGLGIITERDFTIQVLSIFSEHFTPEGEMK